MQVRVKYRKGEIMEKEEEATKRSGPTFINMKREEEGAISI